MDPSLSISLSKLTPFDTFLSIRNFESQNWVFTTVLHVILQLNAPYILSIVIEKLLVRIPLETYIFILKICIAFRSSKLGKVYANEIQYDIYPE